MILPGILASGISGHLGGNYYSIATQTLGSAANTVTFSSIPSTYTHLQVRAIGINSGGESAVRINFNSDSGSNYAFHWLYGNGSSAAANNGASQTTSYAGDWNTTVGNFVLDILDYTNNNKNKTTRSLGGYDANGSGSVYLSSGLWMSTATVNSITFQCGNGNFNQYTSFALYGIK